jgi:hypothetical protein
MEAIFSVEYYAYLRAQPHKTSRNGHARAPFIKYLTQMPDATRALIYSSVLNYLALYKHHIPKRAIGSKTPVLALKEWQQKRPELFVKRFYDQTGLDNSRFLQLLCQ